MHIWLSSMDRVMSAIQSGSRYAVCPNCDDTAPRVLTTADAVEWFCHGCDQVVVAPAQPSSVTDMDSWVMAGNGHHESDPKAWGRVTIALLRRDGCPHPPRKRKKLTNGSYVCGVCGYRWEYRKRLPEKKVSKADTVRRLERILKKDPRFSSGMSRAMQLFRTIEKSGALKGGDMPALVVDPE